MGERQDGVGSKGKGREEPTLTTMLSGKATSIESYTRDLLKYFPKLTHLFILLEEK